MRNRHWGVRLDSENSVSARIEKRSRQVGYRNAVQRQGVFFFAARLASHAVGIKDDSLIVTTGVFGGVLSFRMRDPISPYVTRCADAHNCDVFHRYIMKYLRSGFSNVAFQH